MDQEEPGKEQAQQKPLRRTTRREETSDQNPKAVAGDGREVSARLGAEQKDHQNPKQEILDRKGAATSGEIPIQGSNSAEQDQEGATDIRGGAQSAGSKSENQETQHESDPSNAFRGADNTDRSQDEEKDGDLLRAYDQARRGFSATGGLFRGHG
jgi:hypothetical protein